MRSHTVVQFLFILIVLSSIPTALFADQKEIKIGVASTSPLKKKAVLEVFQMLFPNKHIHLSAYSAQSNVAEQPVGENNGIEGARNRLKNAQIQSTHEEDYFVAIENYIEESPQNTNQWIDRAAVWVQKKGRPAILEHSQPVSFEAKFALEAKRRTREPYPLQNTGFSITAGKIIQEGFKDHREAILSDDWQKHPKFGGISRKKLIQQAIAKAVIKNEITAIPNFPKAPVTFQDISPLLGNPEIFQAVINLFADKYHSKGIDAVAGLEARGFILGAPLALKMNVPFIPIRKKGKLPRPTHHQRYLTEYSEDEIEISVESLKGKTVLIVDDLLATGGTLKAADDLLKSAGAEMTYSTCLIELLALQGKNKLHSPFFSLIQY